MNEGNPYLHRFNVMPDWANELAFLRSEMAKLQGGESEGDTGICTLSTLIERKPEHGTPEMDDPNYAETDPNYAETTTE